MPLYLIVLGIIVLWRIIIFLVDRIPVKFLGPHEDPAKTWEVIKTRKGQWHKHTFPDGRTYRAKVVRYSILCRILTWGWASAITIRLGILGNRIYIKGGYFSVGGLKHEFAHVRQWSTEGTIGFARQYLKEKKQYGYECNRFEEEARAYAKEPLQCMKPR